MREWTELMGDITGAIDRLLALAAQKREAVVKNDVAALEAVVREETGLTARVALLEGKRQRSAVVFALKARLDPKQSTFRDLIAALPAGEDRDQLERARVQLVDKMQQLERINAINQDLLSMQRDISSFMIERATRPTQLGTQYSGTGRDADTVDQIILVDTDA